MFRKELNFSSLDAQNVFGEIDTSLMGLEHVQPQEKIDITALRGDGSQSPVAIDELSHLPP